MTTATTDAELRELVVKAIEKFDALSPEEQVAHRHEQKISWTLGQLRLAGREVTRQEVEDWLDLPTKRRTVGAVDGAETKRRQCNRSKQQVQPDSVAAHRDERQILIAEWAKRTFGAENWTPRIRALRFIEEAFELCQALGVDTESITRVMNHVYGKPVGTPESELGGVGVALLAVADCANLHAEYQEAREARRVLEKSSTDPEHFKARDQVKRNAGLI